VPSAGFSRSQEECALALRNSENTGRATPSWRLEKGQRVRRGFRLLFRGIYETACRRPGPRDDEASAASWPRRNAFAGQYGGVTLAKRSRNSTGCPGGSHSPQAKRRIDLRVRQCADIIDGRITVGRFGRVDERNGKPRGLTHDNRGRACETQPSRIRMAYPP